LTAVVGTNWARQQPTGILVGIGSAAVIAGAFAAAAFPVEHPVQRYGVLVVTIFVFTAVTGVWAAPAATAGIGFLVFNGFLVNELGELSWHGNADLTRLLALAAAVIFGRLVGDSWRLYLGFAAAHEQRTAAYRASVPSMRVKKGGHDA
jgi:hypothetical protein